MDSPGELQRHLRFLEEQLLQPAIRGDAAALSALLCDDFVEFGSSGRIFDKRSIVVALATETPGLHTISEFKLMSLGKDTALVRYRLSRRAAPDAAPLESLRSSVWRNVRGEWKMAFHQGTRAAEARNAC